MSRRCEAQERTHEWPYSKRCNANASMQVDVRYERSVMTTYMSLHETLELCDQHFKRAERAGILQGARKLNRED